MSGEKFANRPGLTAAHIEDVKLAAKQMQGAVRRAFEAEMVLKYCAGSARRGEDVFGWSRETIQIGLAEKRTGLICIGAQEAFCGKMRWEEQHPEAAAALFELAEAHSQQDPSFRGELAYTRLTAQSALDALRKQGFKPEILPSASTMAEVLNRNHYRLRTVIKAKPQKKSQKPTRSSPTSPSGITQQNRTREPYG